MIFCNCLFKHLLECFCSNLINLTILLNLLSKHLDKQFKLCSRHFYIRQLFKVFRRENIFFLATFKNTFNLIIFKCFFNHFRNSTIHRICIYITCSTHLANKSCNSHKALCKCRLFLAKFTRRLADIESSSHTFYSFQEIRLKRNLTSFTT